MPIATTCPNCKALFRLPDDMVGRKVKCQKCANLFMVPRGEAETTVAGIPVVIDAQPIPEQTQPIAATALSLPPPPMPIDPPAPAPQADADEDRDDEDDDDRYRSGKTKPPPLRKRRADDRSSRSGRDEKPKSSSSKLGVVLAVAGLCALFCIACAGGSAAIWVLDGREQAKKPALPPIAKKAPIVNDFVVKDGKDRFKDFRKDFAKKDGPNPFPIVNPVPNPFPPNPNPINLALAGDGFVRVDNALAPGDPFTLQNRIHKEYAVTLEANKTYRIDMFSNQIDSYLYILDDKNMFLTQDDDSGGNLNALIMFRPDRTAVYRIQAACFGGQEFGGYTLTIQRQKN